MKKTSERSVCKDNDSNKGKEKKYFNFYFNFNEPRLLANMCMKNWHRNKRCTGCGKLGEDYPPVRTMRRKKRRKQ